MKTQMKKPILLTVTLLTIISFLYSCEKGTEPEIIKPGRRDYTWSVDSITVPLLYLTDISGTSPNDLWVVGGGAGLTESIWHYDGKKWSSDGISAGVAPNAVFAIDDIVWVAGGGGRISKYENSKWVLSAELKLQGYKEIGFNNIWGSGKNDIYAIGVAVAENEHRYTQSIIAHYNGSKWKLIDTKNVKCSFSSIKKDPITNQYFVSGTSNELYVPDTSKLFILKDEKLKKVAWEKEDVWDDIFIQITKNELLFGMGKKIKYLSNGKFIPLIDLSPTKYDGGFGGRSIKDIFVGMKDGIMHYNGSSFEYIYYFPNGKRLWLGRMAIFEKDFFQIESSRNYIIHGKLKE